MRNVGVTCGLALAAIVVTSTRPFAAAPASYDGASKVTSRSSSNYEVTRGGCGSRGGPGYRRSNGKCASWDD